MIANKISNLSNKMGSQPSHICRRCETKFPCTKQKNIPCLCYRYTLKRKMQDPELYYNCCNGCFQNDILPMTKIRDTVMINNMQKDNSVYVLIT